MVNISSISPYGKVSNENISFKGHHLTQDDKGDKIYKFYVPKFSYDNAKLVLKKFVLKPNGEINFAIDKGVLKIDIPKNSGSVKVNPSDINLSPDEILGYKFIIDGKEYLDKHRKVKADDVSYNIADMLSSDILQTPKSIYHLIPGSFNPILSTAQHKDATGREVISDDKTAKMHHFMKHNANLDTIISSIPYIKGLGFRRLLSTPIFGQDNISEARYWTTNPYQITESLGNISDFDKLQIELFKNSMGHIADGAFTSEGLMGIHFRDVLRNGNASPFAKWFSLSGKPMLGVLPDKGSVYDNLGVRIINSPLLWSTDSDGMPLKTFGDKNPNYNPNKETLVQIYDKRLTSEEQLSSDKPFTSYAIKNLKNKDEIVSWTDAVHPYSFPVNVDELKAKFKMINKSKHLDAHVKESLFEWSNFRLTNATASANVGLWTGSKDMAKLRFTFPQYQKVELLENSSDKQGTLREIDEIEKATQEVQNYIASIGAFWTNRTAKTLRRYIAKQLAGAKNADDFRRIILAKVATGDFPKEMVYVTVQQINNALNGQYNATKSLRTPISVKSALKEYPLEALEVSDDLLSIFAHPKFKEAANETLYKELMPSIALDVLKELDYGNLACGNLLNGNKIENGKNKIVQLIADDISRFILLKSLSPELSIQDIFGNSKNASEKLKNITAAEICPASHNIAMQEECLIDFMAKGMKKIQQSDIDELAAYLKGKLDNITPDAIKVADLIIDKTEAGLNWRIDAAKDVAEIEAYSEGLADLKESWGSVVDFWKKFNDNVKLYNNHAYKIAEITDSSVISTEARTTMENTGNLESKMIEQGGFTAQTNYNYIFDTLQRYFTAMPEHDAPFNSDALDLICNKFERGWSSVPGYLYSGSKNNIVFSHAAVGNHDKQRIAHTFSMNMLLPYIDEKALAERFRCDAYWRNIADKIYEDLLHSSMDKSRYSSFINEKRFNRLFLFISAKNLAKIAAFNDALAKATKDIPDNEEFRTAFAKTLDKLASFKNPAHEEFFYKDFETTYNEIVDNLPLEYKSNAINLKGKIHRCLMIPAEKRGIELAKLMVALPGNPTLFAGDELFETGGEEKSKNVKVQNRNRIHWEYTTDKNFEHIKEFSKQLSQIFALRNDKSISSLVNGDTLLLPKQIEYGGRGLFGMYRYNDHDDCIVILHNSGYNSCRNFRENTFTIPSFNLSAEPMEYYPEGWTTKDNNIQAGLPFKLPEGSKFVDALNPNRKFVIRADGNLYSEDGKEINIDNAVTILKRDNK